MLSPIDENKAFGLDESAKQYLKETTRWTLFLSIVGMIFLGLMLLGSLGLLLMPTPDLSGVNGLPEQNATFFSTMSIIGFGIIMIVVIALYFYPMYALLKFSSFVKRAIRTEDQELLNRGFRAQRNLYLYLGIITVLIIAFYIIIFIFGLLGQAIAGA